MKSLIIVLSTLLTGCITVSTPTNVSKGLDEFAQRFAKKPYSIESIKGEDNQFKITVYNSNVQKRRLNRQVAMRDVCPYSTLAEVLAEKDDHKIGKTQVVVWCRPRR